MSIENDETIYVRLLDEVVEVWRPVKAIMISESTYRLLDGQSIPEDEEWEFHPGELVAVEPKSFDGASKKVAVKLL